MQHETQERALQLLHPLPPREQAIIRDHILEGKPLAQIGDEPVVHPI
ncbi:MAG TPA: hypothetical protein VNK04_15610 [Gemmataceae bacterium]|nr:hypothetical protein [Gemmataceae bacterium]